MSSHLSIDKPVNPFTDTLLATLKRHPKRIVFPEGEDLRVIRVAARLVREEAVAPILVGDRERITKLAADNDVDMKYVRIVTPETSSDLALFCERFERIERLRGNPDADAREIMVRPHFFASMMVQYGQADAMVAGNKVGVAAVYRAATRMIKPLPDCKQVFGITAAYVPAFEQFGNHGMIFMADNGVADSVSVEDLGNMASLTGQFAFHLKGSPVRVALLSSSTKGSNPHSSAKKVEAAAALAKSLIADKYLSDNIAVDGELQIDAALDPEVMRMRGYTGSSADVLIFPDVDTGDIVSRLLDMLPDVRVYGLFLAGLALPVVQIPRMASEDRIFGSALIAGLEAIKFHQLHPMGNAEVF